MYRAFDPQLRREVALKTIVPTDVDLRRRFRREAEIAASLVHPRIVTIHDFGEFSQGEPFLVQELLPGEDLDELLERRLPATLGERLTILEDVLEGLAYAHRLGVVHRDVKPGNVRVLPDGHAKLLDFGIARVVGAARASRRAHSPRPAPRSEPSPIYRRKSCAAKPRGRRPTSGAPAWWPSSF